MHTPDRLTTTPAARAIPLLVTALLLLGASGCVTSMAPGHLDWVAAAAPPDTPRAGQVYLIRGWGGMFSWGIDELARELRARGVSAHVFQSDQRDQLARTMVARYRAARAREPLCIVAHSQGSDDALYIADELRKVGVAVDLLVTLDNVDKTDVPGNVRLAYHYWEPGTFGDSNFLRGLPLHAEPGARVINVNVAAEGHDLCEPGASHVTLDKDRKLRPRLIDHVLAACPERGTPGARTAGARVGPAPSPAGAGRH